MPNAREQLVQPIPCAVNAADTDQTPSSGDRVAELEISVQYKSVPARAGMFTMGLLMPVWAIIVPFCLGLFIALLLQMPGRVTPVSAAMVLLGLIVIPILAIVISAICEDDRLLISKEGLSFPIRMLPILRFRRERVWTDLQSVSLNLDDSNLGKPSGHLTLFFKSGGCAPIRLKDVPPADLEQLLLAIEVWGVDCKRPPELIDFQNSLQNETRGIEQVSYTQMWEEELSRRFSATSFVPLEPGHSLGGRLEIVRQLAFGGLSAIYLAQLQKGDLVVVKEAVVPANADEASRNKALELFQREAMFLVRLNHPQIAKVYDYFFEEGRYYLTLEYLRGQDLRQLIKQNGAQPEENVLLWAQQIASILEYLHAQSPPIIHRDVTPDNLVRQVDDLIVMIDFGAANEFVGTATGTLVGKQAYIAPEQLRGKASLSSDIYALGGTMYYLLTGQDPEALCESHPRDANAEVSEELDALVARCTAMEERERPASAQEVRTILDELIARRAAATAISGTA